MYRVEQFVDLEVGGDLVDYIDPHDINRGYEVFRRMIVDDDYRVRREQAVRKISFPAPGNR